MKTIREDNLMANITLVKLQLLTKNNPITGVYLYAPIIKDSYNRFYWCETLKAAKVLKKDDIKIGTLTIRREIPKEFYEANGLI